LDKRIIERVLDDSEPPAEIDDAVAFAQVFRHEKPFSHCVLGSLDRLLPVHSNRDRLLALELASDLLKNGRGKSVEKFRRAGIDGEAVNQLMRHARSIADDPPRTLAALEKFADAEVAALAYAIGLGVETKLEGRDLRKGVIAAAIEQRQIDVLAGEIMRRKPGLLL
jgi:hypothetical protein